MSARLITYALALCLALALAVPLPSRATDAAAAAAVIPRGERITLNENNMEIQVANAAGVLPRYGKALAGMEEEDVQEVPTVRRGKKHVTF
mmetsp:Transcript_19962/g.49578  ORF Transcript_19962/g.49578 Transcript_19962/m.49578 type:complete len:91 (+) Transcript_19962:111-383(+)|eukprot:CAMPEP_0174909612 /NCGR_PEP_ID=MMETSP0167-20121228/69339_1 /TAXON_ID=38298 /ORGANISM="Rhodella maculata, Strain CCMP736" /LENGTH=90 /DNA_ID=CAMNT_0016153649 /DNA_START=44 /DNA_END=316 /DNA_ORIENTATION=+